MAAPVPSGRAATSRAATLSSWVPVILLLLMTIGFGAGYAWLSVARHLAYQSHAFDLGNMDQAVWNVLQGHGLRFTDMAMPPSGRILTNRFAIHVEPLLYLVSGLYLLHEGPETLLVLQALVVATGAIPAFLLARRFLSSPWMALVFPAAYLLHPSLQNAVLDDFHAVTLSAALLLWALYFLAARSLAGFWIFAVAAMATKEEIALLVALLGIGMLWWHRRAGATAIVLGAAWFAIAVSIVIPHFNPSGQSPYLDRYSYLGHGLRGAIGGALHHPDLVWRTLTSHSRLLYLDALLRPVGYVSLLGLPLLLVALPTLAINMLSAEPTMYSGYYQYSAEIIPFLIAAAILGVAGTARVARRVRWGVWVPRALCLLLLITSLVATRRYGFSPLAAGYVVPSTGAHQRLEDAVVRSIPRSAVVAAADEIEPHLSDRRTIYVLPTVHPPNGPAAQYTVLDASIPSLPVRPAALHRVVTRALRSGYGVVRAKDGILLLRQGAPLRTIPTPFYRFIYSAGSHVVPKEVRWGPLALTGVTVHPGYNWVNRSRPAVQVETYWRATERVPLRTRIRFYCSPVYGDRPPPLRDWTMLSDGPTLTWLPLTRWPHNRSIRVASLPCIPNTQRAGKVDVAVGVATGQRAPRVVRLATVRVDP